MTITRQGGPRVDGAGTRRRRGALGLAGVAVAALAGCNELIRTRLQQELDRFWTEPARKAQAEDDIEREVERSLEASLVGESFEVPGPNPYLHGVKKVTCRLGTRAPVLAVPGTVSVTQTSTRYYLSFAWEADWARGNGASLDVGLDLRTHSLLTFYEYPDHTLVVRNIDAWAKGTAMVVIPKDGSKATASITLGGATIDLDAEAEGWFWSVDVSSEVKGAIRDEVLRELIGDSIDLAFAAS